MFKSIMFLIYFLQIEPKINVNEAKKYSKSSSNLVLQLKSRAEKIHQSSMKPAQNNEKIENYDVCFVLFLVFYRALNLFFIFAASGKNDCRKFEKKTFHQ